MAQIVKHRPKVISARTHAVMDHVQAGANFLAAALLWKRNRKASVAALALGAGVLANALMTDYPLGVFRNYGFKVHGVFDYGVAAASSALPELLGLRHTPETRYFRLQGSGEAAIASLTDYSDTTGARRRHRSNRITSNRFVEIML